MTYESTCLRTELNSRLRPLGPGVLLVLRQRRQTKNLIPLGLGRQFLQRRILALKIMRRWPTRVHRLWTEQQTQTTWARCDASPQAWKIDWNPHTTWVRQTVSSEEDPGIKQNEEMTNESESLSFKLNSRLRPLGPGVLLVIRKKGR